ncbi:MAG: hypothetical protein MH137_12485 [Flavobacteriales bacterium]|nr:hypothetical protein [Flavobacteriales bacterium]
MKQLTVTLADDSKSLSYIKDNRIFEEGWHKLPQVVFWQKVVTLPPDTGILNVHSTREIACKIPLKRWNSLSDLQKETLRDSARTLFGYKNGEKVVFTAGKSDFYDFGHALEIIGEAYPIFEELGVPAFYAQSILLIECPGQLKKSTAGAAGHFQLMPGVATSMGLKVNKYVDERKDFTKCATAAALFIQKVCIPNATKILRERNIDFKPSDLWFKLVVLHVYHAGAGNVAAALDAIPNKPKSGSLDLIATLWQTKAASFGNASQNYSQLALANTVILYDLLEKNCKDMCENPYQYAGL